MPEQPLPQYSTKAIDELDTAMNTLEPHGPLVVGRYQIVAKIAEGGMGAVYRAEQRTPIERTVALKLIRPGFDTPEIVRRFESERQALAWMDHPNIAKVFDAGADPVS